jgi:hypothetical protein
VVRAAPIRGVDASVARHCGELDRAADTMSVFELTLPGTRCQHRGAGEETVRRDFIPPVRLGFHGRGDAPCPPFELVPSLAPMSIIASIGSFNRAPCTWN